VYVAEWGNSRVQYFGARGTISPSGVTSVTAGTNATYTVTPDSGYAVDSVTVDGEPAILTEGEYAFPSVSATHTISVTFAYAPVFYTVHFNTDGTTGSSVSSMTQSILQGGAADPVTASAPTGHHFTQWTGIPSFTTTTTNPVTVSGVSAEMTVTAHFAPDTHTITALTSENGTITPTSQSVDYGSSSTTLTITPNTGYHFVSAADKNGPITAVASSTAGVMEYKFTNVTDTNTIHAVFAADRPAAPYSVTWSPVRGGTLIQWAGSPGATGYQVWLGTLPTELRALTRWNPGRLLGTTGPSTFSLLVGEYLGPNSSIYVVALGTSANSAPGTGIYTSAVTPVQIGTVRFTGNSSRLTPATKRLLRRYASLMATQGFKSVSVSGYTAKFDHGSSSFRRRLSLTRAKVVKAYLATQFRALHVSASISAAGYGGTKPVASNRTKAGIAKNRRAEVLLR
jgi:outer membrane protein OmpA-like peptidoglycan-associated protein